MLWRSANYHHPPNTTSSPRLKTMGPTPMRETVRELSEGSSEVETIHSPTTQPDNEGEMTETEETVHQNTLTDNKQKQSVSTQPRKLYHPDSFLSQSTGQELPSQTSHSSSSSMIFQQSGVNLNMQRSMMTPLTMTKTNSATNQSQPTIERQSSYLSFKAPDRSSRANTQQSGFYQHSRLSSQAIQSATPIGTPMSHENLSGSMLEQTPPLPVAASVGNPEDDMDFSSFLNSSQPQTSSRTQQKLWLQRETIASLNDPSHHISESPISNISTRFKYEEVARSYMHIRRTGNPIVDSLKRLDKLGANRFKVQKSVDASVNEDMSKLKIDLSNKNDLVDSIWKRSIDMQMTVPPQKPIKKVSSQKSTPPMKSATELFHMGQRSFGSAQKMEPINSSNSLNRLKFNRNLNESSTTPVSSPLSTNQNRL